MATGLFNLKQVNQAISQGAWSGYIAPKWVEYLVVAGGGGAGVSGGGGGGGGLLTGIVTVTAGTSYTVTVGSGGAGGTSAGTPGSSGVASVFGSLSVAGGGGGGSFNSGATTGNSGLSGGSGGGGASGYTSINAGTAGQGTANQGNAGNVTGGSIGQPYSGSGGGGAGTIGLSGISNGVSGNGGAGIASAISGTVTAYAGGGAGGAAGSAASPNGIGGVGGGGSAQSTTYTASGYSGSSSLGGGGGGGWGGNGGAGGSGIVVVRYPGSIQFFTGGTLSYANGYMIHTFYASGTLAPTTPTPYVTDYQISRSLRFNSADSAYLNRTPASATNRKTWTLSFWVKRATLGSQEYILFAGSDSNNRTGIRWNNDNLEFEGQSGGATQIQLTTSAVYRDVSAWYHIVYMLDTTQATSSERAKIYVNGSQVTAFGTATYPSQNADLFVNSTNAHVFGRYSPTPSNYLNNYLTEINFIDGQALTPSSFGYTNPATGVWSPLAFVGTYGTNGFELNFSDNSNTTAATLGKDYSGNGNNWTPNNFSVTAGAGNDSLVDSPTSYGTDTGVGGTVRGNYCTLNPLSPPASGSPSYANGNLDGGVASYQSLVSTFSMTSGQWYWEVTPTGNSGSAGYFVAVSDANYPMSTRTWQGANFWGYYQTGSKYTNGGSASYGASFTTNDVIGVALDMDAGTVTFYKNGVSQGVAYSSLTGKSMQATVGDGTSTSIQYFSCNFGQRPFAYTAPSGYKALCTQNLPTPTIGATSTTLATSYFAPVIYTGTGTTQTITVGFQPDFVWNKCRSTGYAHYLEDSVRGATKVLRSASTSAETTETDAVTVFNANGFVAGGNAATNYPNDTYVAWNWRASNATAVTNTAGSITSTVSANTTSGFSVVTYTGTGANATVGHGLGVAPSMVIVKGRNTVSNWTVWHSTFSGDGYILLNSTGGQSTGATIWNSTVPTSTVFSVGTNLSVNESGDPKVAYVFAPVAGYSKFGSYTGNGSTDGTFVYFGFRPAYVMIKASSAVDNWVIMDVARNPYNAVNYWLQAESSVAEATLTPPQFDFVSNGLKLRGTSSTCNASGVTYIYMAFASNPFKTSLAR